ncbi:immunity protein TriTu family protein [Pseudomonas soli]|uniref:immunity protein TriTu family protein n=1 Tax=Pseudomonas soli TaxID=1306993 RepID=UPI003F52E42F
MFAEILAWLEVNSSRKLELNENELSSSVVINVDGECNLARLTLWDDGSCVIEAVDVDTGCYIINERCEIKDLHGFIGVFGRFNSALK